MYASSQDRFVSQQSTNLTKLKWKHPSIFSGFWNRNPALFWGISLLIGGSYAFYPHYFLILSLGLLCWTRKQRFSVISAIICACGAYLYTKIGYPPALLPQDQIKGVGVFHVEQIKDFSSFFNRSLLYRGILKEFTSSEGLHYSNLPCQIFLPVQGKKPTADTDYRITGSLCQKHPYSYLLKPDKTVPWEPIASAFNLAQWRYDTKQSLKRYISAHISDPLSATLLYALSSGEIDERLLKMQLSKVGLQHLLAVSGFHFALLALLTGTLLRWIFPYRISLYLLIAVLSCYYLFIGDTPAIQRAYIAILLVLIGKLGALRISGLNALGVGLMVAVLLNPLSIQDLGFQFSFLCTYGILLFYPTFERLLEVVLLRRTLSEAMALSFWHQHLYLLCSFLRSVLSINLAVHFVSIPVLLCLFHKFPLISFAYNLFFPVCITLSLILLFSALLLAPLLPFCAEWIHILNSHWTSFLIWLTSTPPATLDFSLRTSQLSVACVVLFLCASFLIGVLFLEKSRSSSIFPS